LGGEVGGVNPDTLDTEKTQDSHVFETLEDEYHFDLECGLGLYTNHRKNHTNELLE